MLDTIFLSSFKDQTLSGESARPARTLHAPVFIVFEILPPLASSRARVPAPQSKSQMLPNPDCGFPQGLLNSKTGSISLLAVGSICSRALLERFTIQTD